MTRECDASLPLVREQHTGITWDQVHNDEQYERTSYNYGHQRISAGVSFDLGGARISVGTGGGRYGGYDYGNYGNYGYGNDGYYRGGAVYSSGRYDNGGYRQDAYYDYSNSNYNNNQYRDYGQGYNGYRNGGGYYNAYNQYIDGNSSYNGSYASRAYDRYVIQNDRYNNNYDTNYYPNDQYSYNQQRYQPNYYPQDRYDDRYDNGSGYYRSNPFDVRRNSGYNDGYSYDDYRYNDGGRYGYNDGGRYGYNDNYRGYNDDYTYRYQQQYRNPNGRYADDYRYQNGYDQSGYYNQYDQGGYGGNDWYRMRITLQSMIGRSPSEYNRNVPDDLGCATVVSAALRNTYGLRINDTNVNGLENSLRRNGFEAVPIQYAQPGDTIIAHRGGGRHGHAAIYVGDGKIVNNSSAQGRVVVASVNNFKSRDYTSVVAYRKV